MATKIHTIKLYAGSMGMASYDTKLFIQLTPAEVTLLNEIKAHLDDHSDYFSMDVEEGRDEG